MQRRDVWMKGVGHCPFAMQSLGIQLRQFVAQGELAPESPSPAHVVSRVPEAAWLDLPASSAFATSLCAAAAAAGPLTTGDSKQPVKTKKRHNACPMRAVFERQLSDKESPIHLVPPGGSLLRQTLVREHQKMIAEEDGTDALATRLHFYPSLEGWSPETHSQFPKRFRDAVRCVLLLRTLRPPQAESSRQHLGSSAGAAGAAASAPAAAVTELASRQPYFPECSLWRVPWPLMLRIFEFAVA